MESEQAPRPLGPSAAATATTTATAAAAVAAAAACPVLFAPHSVCCAAMASLRVLAFDHEGRPIQFDTWLDDLQLYLLSDSKDSVSLFDLVSGAATAPPATADSATCSLRLTCDAAARLAIRNHLPLAECTHFGQHRTAQALYDAVVTRYSSPATAALGRLLLPYLFPELSAFATIEDLHLLATETSIVAVGAARGTPRTPFFEGCSPSPLAPSYASAAAMDVLSTEDVGAASASAKRRSSKGKGGRGGGGGSRGGGGGSSGGDGGSGGGGSNGSGGGSGGVGGGGGGSGGSGGSGSGGSGDGRTGAQRGGSRGGQRNRQQRQSESPSPQQLREWLFQRGASGGSVSCPYVIRTGDRAGQTCGKAHMQHRCYSRLDDTWRAEFGDEVERPHWAELLRSGVAIFDLDYDAILSSMYALSASAEGDCYRCVPPDPGIDAAALCASEYVLPGTAPAQALHTFALDSGASLCFFRDSTTLTPLPTPVPVRLADSSGGPVVSHSSTILPCPAVAMVTTTTPGGQCVSICTCTRTGHHLATFTRRQGSSLYTLATEPPQVAASAQVSASGQVALPWSCRLLSHQTLLWHHRLGHPSLPPLRGMHSYLLDRERYFLLVVDDYIRNTMVFPLRSKGEVPDILIPWIRTVCLQLRERFRADLPVLCQHFDRGGEFSSDLLRDFCRVMEVARTSMIHAAAPHFLWPFAVRSLPPLLPSPAPPCLPCIEGRQRAAPHSSFPPTTAPLRTLHMDVWGPARVSGQGRERYFLLVVDDYSRYTTVFSLRSKGQVVDVLIPWIREIRLQLREQFRADLPVLRLHSDRGGEFSSDLLRDFYLGEGILQSFTLPDSPQQNGIAERRIGLVMEVARTSMIHAATPHFLWPFAVRPLPPLLPSPAPPCLPCVEGRQRTAPHSSFPPTTAPLRTLHMDVWGPARVSGQGCERYFLLVVDDYTRYTTVFSLRSKGQVVDVLIPWIREIRLQLREQFRADLPVLRLHSDRGGEFSSDLLRDFCLGEGILQSFTLPDSPQKNGIAERRIGLVMEVARTSMIHAVAPHFLWQFAVRSLPPLLPSPAPPCLPCVEGRQRAAPHSSFPLMTAPLQTLHMDVWGPARVSGQGRERYFLLVVNNYTRYTTVFSLRSKGQVVDVLIPWIREIRLQLREQFRADLPVLRLHSDRGGEFSSDLLRDFCLGEGILQSFMLPDSPQQNGIAEHRIGLVMEVARTSMIHAAAPHFLWPFAVWYTALDEKGWRCVRVLGLGFSCLCSRYVRGQALRPRYSDVTFDESIPYYRLFPYRSAPPPPPSLFLAPGPPPVDPLPPRGPAPSGVSQVDSLPGPAPVEVAVGSDAAQSAASGGVEPGVAESEGAGSRGAELGGEEPVGTEPAGVEPGGAESEGAESGGAEPQGAASSGGPAGASPRLSLQQLREWLVRQARLWSGATGAEGAGDAGARGVGVTAGAGGTGGVACAGPGGARTRGTGAARTGGVGGAIAGDPTEPEAAGAGGSSASAGAGGAGFGGTRAGRAGAGGTDAGGTGVGGTGAGGARARGAGAVDSGGTVRPRPYFVPLLQKVLGVPSSTSLTPPLMCPPPDQSQLPLPTASPLPAPSPYTEQSGGLTERREPASRPLLPVCTTRRVPRSRPPPVPSTYAIALRPSSVPLRVPLPPPQSSLPEVPDPESNCARATSPTVSRLLATAVTDPSFESVVASALVAELFDFATACHLDYATALVAESESASPPSVGGECALDTNVLEDRQEDFECLVAAVPRFASMMNAPEGDPDAPDIPTSRSYAEAITVDGMWIFRVKRLPGSPHAFKARYVARGFSQRQGVDYFQTFSPTPKMTILWVLLHVAAQCDYDLHSLDFSIAFLQGSLYEEIWLRRPLGFTGTTLAALVFAPSTADPSLFLRTNTSLPPFYVLVYVDDLVFATADTEALTLVLQRFGFQFSSPQPTPLSTGHSLSAPPSDESVEPSGPYPELVGCLITSGMGLVLGGRGPVVLTDHADASWVDDSATQQSSQGYTFSLGSGSVSWRSTCLSSILSSSCEAEIYAGAMATQELRWLPYLLTDLGEQPRSPPVLYVDNKAMISLCQEHRLEHTTKHIALRYFLAQELQQCGH
ncbi:unnamed protein product [Closterium sp. NIES-54]